MIIEKFTMDDLFKDELLKLSLDKIYPYIIAMYETKDLELMLRYLDTGIDFLDSHFKGWRFKYIFSANTVKEFLRRILQSNKILYKSFIKKRVPKTKKKVLFTNYSMCIGGAEKALINMVNNMDFSKYDITILLQHKEGPFLNKIDKRVKIESFNLSKSRFPLYRKTINLLKIVWTIVKNTNKYDFSAAYGTGYTASSLVALYASKNNASWMHTNIKTCVKNKFKTNTDEDLQLAVDKYLKSFMFRKFDKHVFVSQNGLNDYLSLYPQDKCKCYLCYNFIDYKEILELSKKKINVSKSKNKINIVNVSRHTEVDKKITRIINAIEKLKDKYDIMLFFVGDGVDSLKYQDMVKEKNLSNNVKFLGAQPNPFPYYLLGDFAILSSAYEGFPTIYTEALTLNIPIVTTNVSDAMTFIKGKYGIVCENNDEDLVNGIEEFIKTKFKIKNKFDPEEFNKQSMEVIERLINNA